MEVDWISLLTLRRHLLMPFPSHSCWLPKFTGRPSGIYHVVSSSSTKSSLRMSRGAVIPGLSLFFFQTDEYKLCFFCFWSQTVLSLVIRVLSHGMVISLLFSQLTYFSSSILLLSPWLEYQSSVVYIRDRHIC